MKIVQMSPPDLTAALLSTDPQRRNQAFKTLYMSPVVNGKIRDWAKMYNLRDKLPDDVLQEGIILLDEIIRTGRFRGDSKVETYLLGICKNLIRDSVKKVNRVVLKDNIPESAMHDEEALSDHLELAELTDSELRRDQSLREVMRQLTEKCQEALRLYYFEQKTMAEVAEARNLANAEQAKKAVFRCRESLRELVSAHPTLQKLI